MSNLGAANKSRMDIGLEPFSKGALHSGFLCNIWSEPDLNLNTVYEIGSTYSSCKKYYIMLVGPNLASAAFRVHCAMYCQLGEGKGQCPFWYTQWFLIKLFGQTQI